MTATTKATPIHATSATTDADHTVTPVVEAPTSAFEGIKLLVPFARFDRSKYLISAGLAFLATACQLIPFWLIFVAVRDVVDGASSRNDLYRLAIIATASIVLRYALAAASTAVSHWAAFATLERLRMRIGERLGRMPLGHVTSRRSGEVQRVMKDDVEKLEQFLAHAIPDLVSAVGTVVLSTAWLLLVDWRMGLACFAVVAVALPLMGLTIKRSGPKMGPYMAAQARMSGSIVEFIRALPVVRTFNRSGESFGEPSEAIRSAAHYEAEWGREFLPLYTAFLTLLLANVVTVLPVGLWLWNIGHLSTTTLLFFFIVGLGYSAPIITLMELFSSLSHLGISAKQVAGLDGSMELAEVTTRAQLADATIRFDGVDFSHRSSPTDPGRQVLFDIAFSASPGTVTALVGPSGAGKTTIARLIPRFWDVDAGSVSIGGVDVRQMPFEQLMEQVAFVFQESFLFNETIADNIRIGRIDATDAQVEAAAQAAQAHEFIARLPLGYQTQIGERGARLSGGEKQRLAIARAIVKDAPIIILDEATAYADPENEAALQDALGALIEGKTLVMIAHRLSTIAGADQILVVDEGRIVERGTHDELLHEQGLYARMWSAFESAENISLVAAAHGSQEQLAHASAHGPEEKQ